MENKFFMCECFTDAISVSKDETFDEVEIAIFRRYNSRRSLKERIKYAWRHLLNGELHEDAIILEKKKAREFGETILEMTK